MERNRYFKKSVIWLFFIMLLVGTALPVSAAGGSISIKLQDLEIKGSSVADVTFYVYRIGTVTDEEGARLYPEYGLTGYPQTASETQAAAETILAVLTTDDAIQFKKTDKYGEAQFRGLEAGVYLLEADNWRNKYGDVSPFIVHLPYYKDVGTEVTGPFDQIEIEPKAVGYPDGYYQDETESETESESSSESESEDESSDTTTGSSSTTGSGRGSISGTAAKNAKTGDDTRLELYMIMLVIAGITSIGVIWNRVISRK